jgi:tetratricopeptide (TPR) repeat protein
VKPKKHSRKGQATRDDILEETKNVVRRKGNLDGAIAEYREALRLKPGAKGAHNNFGLALNQRGDLDAALAELHEALRLKPDYARVLAKRRLGRGYYGMSRGASPGIGLRQCALQPGLSYDG